MKHTIALVFAAVAGLVFTVFAVATMWSDLGVNLTLHGWIAYALGGIGSLLLACGLFYLTFKSAREGYDDLDRPEDLND